MPGIILSSPCSGPIRRSMRWAWRKSSKLNWPWRIAAAPSPPARSAETAFSARSIRLSTSPMPRMREAMRSGWKTSSASSFSPVETNMIGRPVTSLTESAAPPRASPSSLVRTTPSKAIRSWNAAATSAACWPVIASRTSSEFVGLDRRRRRARARPSARSSTWRRPAVSMMTMSRPSATGALEAAARRLDRVGGRRSGRRERRSDARAARAGRPRPAAGGRRRRAPGAGPRRRVGSASLAAAVVLPEPCRPASRITDVAARARARPRPRPSARSARRGRP